MRFFNVEIPEQNIPPDACYITRDADGEINAWPERPTCFDSYWFGDETAIGHTDDVEEWRTHWYVKLEGAWWYELIEPHSRIDGFHWDTAPRYAEGHNALHTPPLRGREDIMMRFFNVEIPEQNIPPDARYITVDADGEIDAWPEQPELIDWFWDGNETEIGETDEVTEWNTHWYVKIGDTDTWFKALVDVPDEPVTVGRKDDAAKLRYDLLPPHALEQLTAVLTYGAEKYGANNWQHVSFAEDRYYAATLRHIQAWRQGELNDPESGLPHLAHAMCSLTFLLEQNDER